MKEEGGNILANKTQGGLKTWWWGWVVCAAVDAHQPLLCQHTGWRPIPIVNIINININIIAGIVVNVDDGAVVGGVVAVA